MRLYKESASKDGGKDVTSLVKNAKFWHQHLRGNKG
jgi:hypothetical protein